MLTDEQINFAAMYTLRWRGMPDDEEHRMAVGNEVRVLLKDSEIVRGIAGAVLRSGAPIKSGLKMLCGRCRRTWPSGQDAWVCYSSGCTPHINEVR